MKKITLIIFLFLKILNSNAQLQCGTDELEQLLLRTNPQYASERRAVENFIQQRTNTNARIANTGCQPILSIYTIPVVFHVMHLGEAVGTGTNISEAAISDAMSGINQRWTQMGIQFVLAKRAPDGSATNGITRTDCSSITGYAMNGVEGNLNYPTGVKDTIIKRMSMWDWKSYMNIWIVVKASVNGSLAAYANLPSNYKYQGIVFPYGSTASSSSIAAHEVGHYMGLYHTFQGATTVLCAPNTSPLTQGDNVADTPPHLQADCNYISCDRYTDSLNSLLNIMSYCSVNNRFTQGQKERVIDNLFNKYRWNLVISDGLIPATTLLEAKIDSIANDITENICINFTPKLRIKNLGTNLLSTCKIQTYIDDVLQNTTTITNINLQKDSSKIVSLLPVSSVYNTHSFRFVLSQINGSDTDFFALNNSVCGDINLIRNNYNVFVSTNNGSATGIGSYSCDSMATLKATPNTCYQFTNWTENGNIVSTNSTYSFVVTYDRDLVANFTKKRYAISLSVNDINKGTIVGNGNYGCDTSVTVRSHIKTGARWLNWTENSTIVSTDSIYTFTATSNRNLVANFEQVITAIKQTSINQISKIYPNPANDILQIEIRSKQNTSLSLNIIDMKGSLLETKTLTNSKGTFNTTFDVSKLSKGNYILNLYDEEGVASYKFVVK